MSTFGIVSQPGRSRKDRFERISDRAGAPGRFNGRSRVTGLDKRGQTHRLDTMSIDWKMLTMSESENEGRRNCHR